MSWNSAWIIAAAWSLTACQALPFFETEPCEPRQTRWQACGVCDAGRIEQVCTVLHSWVPVDSDALCGDNPYDGDGDGSPNELCRVQAGDCCGDAIDCDDDDPERWPGHADSDLDGHDAESCGGDDCDDSDPLLWTGHADADGDGHDAEQCGGDDCDDTDRERYTGHADLDGDGRVSLGCGGNDCNDDDPHRWGDPADREAWLEGADLDGDGHPDGACGGDDCNDYDVSRWEGHADLDGDGHVHLACGGDDCDDDCPTCYPGASDVCGEARDHDCDGQVDELGECAGCFPSSFLGWGPLEIGPVRDLFVSEPVLYATTEEGLTVVVGWSPTGAVVPMEDAGAVFVNGHHAYVACRNYGVRVVDVTDPSSPHPVDAPPAVTGDPRDLVVFDDHLFVASASGLYVVDVVDPTAQRVVAGPITDADGGGFQSIAAWDRYVLLGGDGVVVVDVSVPESPVVVSRYVSPVTWLQVTSMEVRDGFAYVTSPLPAPGLYVLDVRDPSAPVLAAGPVLATGLCHDVVVTARFAHLAGDHGVHLVDVTRPEHPVYLRGYDHHVLGEPEMGLPRSIFTSIDEEGDLAVFVGTDLGVRVFFWECGCPEGPENTEEACSDGCSNDYDDLTDCDDWSCQCTVVCGGSGCDACEAGAEDTLEACLDGCDNDADGLMDCGDPGCACTLPCGGLGTCDCELGPEDTEPACSDGCTNDGDFWVDCDDWDCRCAEVCGGAGCGEGGR